MSSAFYKSIIEDEMKVFGIKEAVLIDAAKSVANTYNRRSLNRGQTFLEYNVPPNRCAYIYKYAHIHTALVVKYFKELIAQKKISSSLKSKKTLKICCLGGGPGTDVVGLFKVLALFSHYHKKVVEVTVLDICGGWRNSFKRIISNLIEGKFKDVPETFVNASNFKFKLIEVNLLCHLPSNIVTVLSEADIVCMVKFVSAILGSSASVSALEVIGKNLKIGAVVLFIDNFRGNTFKPFLDISGGIGLKCVYGPLHESFNKKNGFVREPYTSNEKNVFGCSPLKETRVTVLGFIKSDKICNNVLNPPRVKISKEVILDDGGDDDDDDSWDTDDESESSTKQPLESPVGYEIKVCQDKYTQTYEKFFSKSPNVATNVNKPSVTVKELNSLVEHLCDLVDVLSRFKQQMSFKNHCCH